MTNLTAKQASFITFMTESEELARRGYDLLLAKPGFESYFDALAEAGLFDPCHNPAPVPAEDPGFFRIPYWQALNYLEAVAKFSGERNDHQLAEKVMKVVRTVSQAREPDGQIRDNYHTYRKFSEILGLVPTAIVTPDDIDLVPGWLAGKFGRGLVGHALGEGAMNRFLTSDSTEDWNKACLLLNHCTATRVITENESGKTATIVEDYWLKELIDHNSEKLGARVGKKASEIFLTRLREVFGQSGHVSASWLFRPAIENHTQNRSWNGPENRFVEGLRDVLLSWADHDQPGSQEFVQSLLKDDAEIARRIGISVLSQRWRTLRSIYSTVLGPQLFDIAHIHELYGLLRDNFQEFTENEKTETLKVLRLLPPPLKSNDPDRTLKYDQRNWLSAMSGKGYEPVESWYNELLSNKNLGALSTHPDFHGYIDSCWPDPDQSPYGVQELLALAGDGSIVEKLNTFKESPSWGDPTTEGLVSSLKEAVSRNPQAFLYLLPAFLSAKRPFQFGLINGFKLSWDAPQEKQPGNFCDNTWSELVGFFEKLIDDSAFWADGSIEDQYHKWIPPAIAEFLRAGTCNDEKAYPSSLLPRTWSLIKILLDKSEPELDARETDAMSQAINSSKGKAIEALFSHALRACRLSDKASGEHKAEWATMKPVFDLELAKCKNANYEFSTLAGSYISHLDYINREWLKASVEQIFPTEFPINFVCALSGLTYSQATRSVYGLLATSGVLDRALPLDIKDDSVREKLIERISLAYLWGEEELDLPRFSYLFKQGRVKDLEYASWFFWSISNQELTEPHKKRIISFWERCIAWSRNAVEPPVVLLSGLSRLSCYLKSAEGSDGDLLLAVAPYVQIGYNADQFIEELTRLVEGSPAKVSEVLGRMLETFTSSFDFEGKLKLLVQKLAKLGRRKEALSYAERLHNLPGMNELFAHLIANP